MTRTLRFLSFALMLMVTTFASAKDYVLVEGNNKIEAYTSMNATFTAEKDCKVLIEAGEVFSVVYDGKTYEHKYSAPVYNYEIDNVKAGGVITITSGFTMNGGNLKITVVEEGQLVPVEIKSVNPGVGKKLSWSTTGMVSISFNKAVAFSSVKIKVGNTLLDVDDMSITGSNVGVTIANILNKVLGNGMLNAGDTFSIVFTGLCDAENDKNLYNGDGKLTLDFVAPAQQHNFVKASVGETELSYFQANNYTFLSYYPVDGTDGLFVVEFDGDVKSLSSVHMTMGNLDLSGQGKYHMSAIPYTIEGNKVIVDARGTLRTLAILFPDIVEEDAGEGEGVSAGLGEFDTEHVTVTLSNVIDVNDNAFASNLPGSVGSFSFVMNYKEIVDEINIDGDNKFSGDSVMAGEEISFWVSSDKLKFEAISVSYTVEVTNADEMANPENELNATYEKKEVLVTEYSVVPDAFEGVVITFVMPEMPGAVPGKNVRVSLHNASSVDGMPHSLYLDFVAAEPIPIAIDNVSVAKNSSKVYTLGGVEIGEKAANRGLYIINGRKILK